MKCPVLAVALLGAVLAYEGEATARMRGQDVPACDISEGLAIHATIIGLKDRTGRLKLELYPATEEDFLESDTKLIAAGKTFHRVWADVPEAGPVSMCIKVPKEGTYALFFTHDRDGKNKFNFWRDGGGVPGNRRIGAARPKLSNATITVGSGVTFTTIQVQYLRGLSGLGPVKVSE